MPKKRGKSATFLSTKLASQSIYYVVDAFTNQAFKGNPAAVVLLQEWKEEAWLQQVAAEMNLSETAFLIRYSKNYELRWFTPKVEVDLCGHATIAAACALAENGMLDDESSVAFNTQSGVLTATRHGSKFLLDFPKLNVRACKSPSGLLDSLSVTARFVGRSKFDYLVELESDRMVRDLAPDFKKLATVKCRGIIVTARSSDPTIDFVSRFFAPAAGIDEDPVTGSSHCCLAQYWGKRLCKQKMLGYQASARGGIVEVEISGDRVILGGEARIFAMGLIMA